jgi:hypothetical protein
LLLTVVKVWWVKLKARDHLEDLGGDGRIILKWIFNKYYRGGGLGID